VTVEYQAPDTLDASDCRKITWEHTLDVLQDSSKPYLKTYTPKPYFTEIWDSVRSDRSGARTVAFRVIEP